MKFEGRKKYPANIYIFTHCEGYLFIYIWYIESYTFSKWSTVAITECVLYLIITRLDNIPDNLDLCIGPGTLLL